MFHVPEAARITPTQHRTLGSTAADGNNGAFVVPSPEPGWLLFLICSDGEAWEHVSVHADRGTPPARTRTPTWREMVFIKDLCWDAEDLVMQLHPRRAEYVNAHPHTLHLWRPIGQAIPSPPAHLVGPLVGPV